MNNGDHSSATSWWLRSLDRVNIIVTLFTGGFILYTRSAAAVYFSAGAVLCSITVKMVKLIIRQPRPLHPSSRKKSYGMPSTHSASMAFFAVYIPLSCAYLPIHQSLPNALSTRVLPPLIIVPATYTIAASRVWLGHHTYKQVAVGLAYGCVFAISWFKLWNDTFRVYGNLIEEWAQSRLLHMFS